MALIPNAELRLEDIPPPGSGWDLIGEFALTFDGYEHWGSFDECARIGNSQKADTLAEARTCLFFEQRRWRHYGYDPHAEAMAYISSLVEIIRAKVQSGDME